MRDYIYILNLAPKYRNQDNWGEIEDGILEKHNQRLARQEERGVVKYVGKTDLPLENDENFGLVVFQSENDTMAELFMQSDPAIMKKLMTGVCHPFKHVY
jgi:hypothetical protein